MAHQEEEKEAMVLRRFRREKVMVIKRLAELLRISIPTARRRLKKWGKYTSYNKNGRYYTLVDIPKFDENRLWKYKGVNFFRDGGLKEAVKHIVRNSGWGLSANEIGEIVGISPKFFLSHFRNEEGLHREKVGGRYVYFSSEEDIFQKQRQKRLEQEEMAKLRELPADVEAVIILVERIRNPDLDIEGLCAKLRRKGYSIKAEAVRNLFEHHGILKKTQGTGW